MGKINVDPVTPDFAARVTGIDLTQPLSAEHVREIEAAIAKYGMLVFPGPVLTQEQLVQFGHAFGELDTGLQKKAMKQRQTNLSNDAITNMSNVDADGNVVPRHHFMSEVHIGNRYWHSDASYEHKPWRYSFLTCVRPAKRGGDTQFADLRAAYDDLDPDLKDFIQDKVAIFFCHFNRMQLGYKDARENMPYPPTRWPLVRTHKPSGRKLIWCETRVAAIEGMRVPEARAVAQELIEHIGQREHVYSHKWSAGDIVMYDNSAVLHRGMRFDLDEAREMRRVATVGDEESLGELPYESVL